MLSALASVLLATLAVAAPTAKRATGTKYLFVFGDSYSTNGFSISGTKPSAANPIGNPALPGSTMSGGLSWNGFLVTQLNTSLTLDYNFAVSGATVDNSIIPAFSTSIASVSDQVTTWNNNLASKPSYAPWTAENSLFLFFIGTNDVGNTYSGSGETAKLGKDLDRLFTLATGLYSKGARNFGFLTIPPTNLTPLFKSEGQPAALVTALSTWNNQLPTRIDTFKTANTEANVTTIDTSKPWLTAINDPKTYGAPDNTCTNSNGKSCLWFNTYHPGIAINLLIAKAVAAAYNGTFF